MAGVQTKGEPDHPERDQAWDSMTRDETEIERLDRNWSELLQELRVTQTGVQLLTGFLLTLPFQQRFQSLDSAQRRAYLVVVALSAGSTTLLVAPVLMHRLLFRRHERRQMVSFAHRCAMVGAYLLGLALVGVIYLIFDVTEGMAAALIAGVGILAAVLVLWLAVPCWLRRERSERLYGRSGRRVGVNRPSKQGHATGDHRGGQHSAVEPGRVGD
jgi:hypothetical protein